jgi:galactokinase
MTGEIASRFRERFGKEPRVFRAPGRINIIGEHTDYSGGLVMPAVIDRYCVVAAAANEARSLRVVSNGFGDAEADLDALARTGTWIDYVAGVASMLMKAGIPVPGADLMIESNVPVGAGISSSAALEVSAMHALLAVANRSATGLQIARWAQAAENHFVGMPCGVMDQFASANGMAGAAFLFNCATFTLEEAVPFPMAPASF